MLFLSRSDIKELVLELGEGDCLGYHHVFSIVKVNPFGAFSL
jgi:hypothetical protein